ncbi:MAG: DMT family transporter [Clostridiales bacterium]|nr:DMT family transporter [Clostridiales bacterium]
MNRYKGIACIIFSAFCFALLNVCVRLAGDVPSIQKSFFRNLIAFIIAALILWFQKAPLRCQPGNLKFLLLRSAFGTVGILANFYAVDHLALADASMLNKLSPFFATLFSIWILKEKATIAQLLGVVGAFAGALFILKPSFANANLFASMIGFIGGLSAGMAYTMVRLLGERNEQTPLIICFFSAFSCLIVLPTTLLNFHPMTLQQTVTLLLAGIAAAGGQFGITAAYCYAPAREISVYDYSMILFAAIFGYFIFDQIPDIYSVIGYVIICGIAVWMFQYNKKHAPAA